MIGMLLWKEPQGGIRQRPVMLVERNILHARFLCAEIVRGTRTPEAALSWRVSSAARRLRRAGVTRAVLPESFLWGAQLAKHGVRPVSTLALRRRLAADWVRQALAERGVSPGGARIAVSAAQMTGELVRTVTELSLRHRYVLLDVPYGAEELCRRLDAVSVDYGLCGSTVCRCCWGRTGSSWRGRTPWCSLTPGRTCGAGTE